VVLFRDPRANPMRWRIVQILQIFQIDKVFGLRISLTALRGLGFDGK
jgi:hypothetical protein